MHSSSHYNFRIYYNILLHFHRHHDKLHLKNRPQIPSTDNLRAGIPSDRSIPPDNLLRSLPLSRIFYEHPTTTARLSTIPQYDSSQSSPSQQSPTPSSKTDLAKFLFLASSCADDLATKTTLRQKDQTPPRAQTKQGRLRRLLPPPRRRIRPPLHEKSTPPGIVRRTRPSPDEAPLRLSRLPRPRRGRGEQRPSRLG